jgi:predicted nucleic acid-binding protein
MLPIRLYIETSVWSHYFADDAPQWRNLTREFFRSCQSNPGHVLLHISDVVLQEVAASSPQKREDLTKLILRFHPASLDIPSEVRRLAEAYVVHGAIPGSHAADAMHAAVATVFEMDALVSWNYRHMVRLERRRRIAAVNVLMGYNKLLEIVTPHEVLINDSE